MITLLALSLAACPTRSSWPTKEWPVDTDTTQAQRAAEVSALTDFAFTLEGTDGERKGVRTDGLIIVKSGTIIYEHYGRGFAVNNRHISWSVAKSFSSALAGVAVLNNVLKVDDSICTYVKAREDLCPITVQNLMEFGSGMHWQENYENKPYQSSSVIEMIFGEGHRDTTAFILSHRKVAEPGMQWQYSTGEAALLSEVVRQAGLEKLGEDWFWTDFFHRIGMKSAIFEGDVKSQPGGGSFIFATPRDYARFGYLYLNDGCWAGERVLPDGWVKSSSTMSETFKNNAAETEDTANGWMFWTNDIPPKRTERPWKDAPVDTYAALGHWGQRIFIIPSKDVVIVRTGDDREAGRGIDNNEMIRLSLEVAK